MYVTVFGASRYVDHLVERPIGGRVLHDATTILRDTDLHAPGVERGTHPYGGHGRGASYVHRAGVTTPGPTLPPRDLFEHLVRPQLDEAEERDAAAEPAARVAPEHFLDPAIAPVHRGDTRVETLVDGLDYFAAAAAAIARTGAPGDAIFLQGYQFAPDWQVPGDPSGMTIGALMADRAARGVDVRVVLNTTAVPVNPWRENESALRTFNGYPSLAGRGLADGAGASMIGTQHQKVLVVRAGGELTGFATGMDFVPDHFDVAPHGAKRWPDGSAWGWHDLAVRITGPAVRAMWDNFADCWARVADPASRVPPVPPCPPIAASPSPYAVQVLRSFFGRGMAPVHELAMAMKRAIRLAERYIYVEDQFLCDHVMEHLGYRIPPSPHDIPAGFSLFDEVADRMRARPGLKAIFVGSGKSDPIDFLPGARNRRFTPSLRRLRDRLPPSLQHNLGVWRIDDVTVHSKVVLVDDAFAAVGSGNFRSRSTYGVDTELQVAYVAADDSVRRLRTALWAELLGLEPIEQPLLDDLDRSLAHLHPGWGEAPPLPAARRRTLTRVDPR
jgi:phosphatidylserine/phosphatidylglycerophosphate/cardiolipin synthase-like enzyme